MSEVRENIDTVDLSTEMKTAFMTYGLTVVRSRALPDVRDGLKPINRRILYMMSQLGMTPDKKTVKCARLVGEVMGKVHPHGDSSIYEALVGMALPWSNNLPTVTPQGNFGSPGKEDPPAAPRYTECKMAPAAVHMVSSLHEDTVDWDDNYDASMLEPQVLPAAIPYLLVNGTTGIAVGMACSFLPHNLREVVSMLKARLADPQMTLEAAMSHLPGPDFPTGGVLHGVEDLKEIYTTGQGSLRLRAKVHVEDGGGKRKALVVTELPFKVGPESVLEGIDKSRKEGKLEGVHSAINLSDRTHGTRLVIEVKVGFDHLQVLEQIFAQTKLQVSVSFNQVALIGLEPKRMGLLELADHYLDHRKEVVRRRSEFRLAKAKARAHILEGLITAHDVIDEVVKVIRAAPSATEASEQLQKRFDLTQVQAQAVLDMTLRRLTGLEITALRGELSDLKGQVKDLEGLLGSPQRVSDTVAFELEEVAKQLGSDRKTQLSTEPIRSASSPTPKAESHPVILFLSAAGDISTVQDPKVPSVVRLETSTDKTIAVITSDGLAHYIEASRPTPTPTPFTAEQAVGLAVCDSDEPVVLATSAGAVKRIAPTAFAKRDAMSVISLPDGVKVVSAFADQGSIALVSSDAKLISFSSDSVRPSGRGSAGVAGMKLSEGAEVIAAGSGDPESTVLVVSSDHHAKATMLSAFPPKNRAGSGVRCFTLAAGTSLELAHVGPGTPLVGSNRACKPVKLIDKRDGRGAKSPVTNPIHAGVAFPG